MTKQTLAEELWDQFVLLSDPQAIWVKRSPSKEREACLVARGAADHDWFDDHTLSEKSQRLLMGLIHAEISKPWWFYVPEIADWNDKWATKVQVLHVLEEAYWWAKEEGL